MRDSTKFTNHRGLITAQQSYIQRRPGCNSSMRINNRATCLCPRPMFIVKCSYQGIKVSRYQGIKVSRYQGIKVSRYQGIKVSRYQGIKCHIHCPKQTQNHICFSTSILSSRLKIPNYAPKNKNIFL
jgi:hypothetical protein